MKKILSLVLVVCMTLAMLSGITLVAEANGVTFSTPIPVGNTESLADDCFFVYVSWNTDDAVSVTTLNSTIEDTYFELEFLVNDSTPYIQVWKNMGWGYTFASGGFVKLAPTVSGLQTLNAKMECIIRTSGLPVGVILHSAISSARSFGGSFRFYLCDSSGNKLTGQLGNAVKVGQKTYDTIGHYYGDLTLFHVKSAYLKGPDTATLPVGGTATIPLTTTAYTNTGLDAGNKYGCNIQNGSPFLSGYVTSASVTDSSGNHINGLTVVQSGNQVAVQVTDDIYRSIGNVESLPIKVTVSVTTLTESYKTVSGAPTVTATHNMTLVKQQAYSIAYNPNGGTGSMNTQSVMYGNTATLNNNAFTYNPTITYLTDGGSVSPETASVPATFVGWEDRGTTAFNGTTYPYYSFDAPGYANRNPDVLASGYCNSIYDKSGLLQHFVEWGKNEYANGSASRAGTTGYMGTYPNGAKVSNLTVTVNGIVPLYAKWNYGTTTLPTPTREGYTFVNWKADLMDIATLTDDIEIADVDRGILGKSDNYATTENLIPVVGGTTFTSNMEVCGVYSYDKDGNFLQRSSKYATTHTIPTRAAFVRVEVNTAKGIDFAGFKDLSLEYTLNAGTTVPVGGNQTYTAQWSKNYDITFDGNGGSGSTKSYVTMGASRYSKVDWLNPQREGYTFAGWATEKNGGELVYGADGVCVNGGTYWDANGNWKYDGALTVYAQWTPLPCTVTVTAGPGGTATGGAANVNSGTVLSLKATPDTGYSFLGWYVDGALVATTADYQVTVAGDKTYTAMFILATYTITFDSDGGSTVAPLSLNYGATVTPPANPTKEGYNFAGWVPALPATMPAQNITVKAQWDLKHVHDDVDFIKWTSTTSLPTAPGNYYLDADVTLSSAWAVPAGTVNLCLNGKKIDLAGKRINVPANATLNIYDCGDTVRYYNVTNNLWTLTNETTANSTTGGIITGGGSSAICVNGGTLALNGGNIVGNTGNAGGVWLVNGGTFTMNDGNILGNYSKGDAGGVMNDKSSFTLNGGNITKNYASNNGGGVFSVYKNAVFNMTGGAITYNTSAGASSGVGNYEGAKMTMSGGSVSNNSTTWGGGGIYNCNAELTVTGGAIQNNTSTWDGAGICNEGTLYLAGSPVISGNTVNGNANNILMIVSECPIVVIGEITSGPIPFHVYAGDGALESDFKFTASENTAYNNVEDFACGNDGYKVTKGQDGQLYVVEIKEYTVTATTSGGGTVTGGGVYAEDAQATLTATPDAGYGFIGWYEGEQLVSSNATYVFTVTTDKTYTAKFEKEEEPASTIVCYIGETGYCSLADAVAAATDGDTIWMVANDTVSKGITVDKSITIELEGVTLTDATFNFVGDIDVYINDRVGTAKVNTNHNSGFMVEDVDEIGADAALNVNFGAKVVISGVTYGTEFHGGNGENDKTISVGTGANLTINGSTIRYYGTDDTDGILVCNLGVLSVGDVYVERYNGSNVGGPSLTFATAPSESYPFSIKKGRFFGQMVLGNTAIINGTRIPAGTTSLANIEKAYLSTATNSYINYEKTVDGTEKGDWDIWIGSDLSTETDVDNVVDSTDTLRVSAGGTITVREGQSVSFEPQVTGGDGVSDILYSWTYNDASTDVTTQKHTIESTTFDDAGTYVFTARQSDDRASATYILNVETAYTITVKATEGGTAKGGGAYFDGDTATLKATPSAGYSFAGWYEDDTLVSSSATYSIVVTGDKTFTAKFEKGVSVSWAYDKDSGYFMSGDSKSSVMRFLFDVTLSGDVDVEASGIKFIRAQDITEDVENATMIDAGLTGNVCTFYGDITGITEDKTGNTYYAVAYVVVNGKVCWSKALGFSPDFNKLIEY